MNHQMSAWAFKLSSIHCIPMSQDSLPFPAQLLAVHQTHMTVGGRRFMQRLIEPALGEQDKPCLAFSGEKEVRLAPQLLQDGKPKLVIPPFAFTEQVVVTVPSHNVHFLLASLFGIGAPPPPDFREQNRQFSAAVFPKQILPAYAFKSRSHEV